MFEKKYFVIGAAVAYMFLITLFFMVKEGRFDKESYKFGTVCNSNYDSFCLRFCCYEDATCDDKFIRENFNKNISHNGESQDIEKDFKILYGAPNCDLIEITDEWEFDYVS